MRLIDANELVKAIENENPGLSISGAVEKFARIAQVNMQPTVTAIPIEWIRCQKMESNLNVIDYALGVIDGHNCCIDMLIRKWEKENETN